MSRVLLHGAWFHGFLPMVRYARLMAERDNDLVGKAKSKFGEVANQAIAAAARQHRLDTERRVLTDLRSQAFSLRAQVGEEMYKLWQAGSLPPSSLDHLF